ncbi:translation initiation factor IF-2-like [Acinonyx jubatus]|uniref:Translation initiation factor IF-2-like n=1 Tax=Acinonyx jubatus TaxID=32536 RepID=A0ABM3Q6N3_ACIJB|nr:translation initiation factor IF-2-like [Acinonyx jubatus]
MAPAGGAGVRAPLSGGRGGACAGPSRGPAPTGGVRPPPRGSLCASRGGVGGGGRARPDRPEGDGELRPLPELPRPPPSAREERRLWGPGQGSPPARRPPPGPPPAQPRAPTPPSGPARAPLRCSRRPRARRVPAPGRPGAAVRQGGRGLRLAESAGVRAARRDARAGQCGHVAATADGPTRGACRCRGASSGRTGGGSRVFSPCVSPGGARAPGPRCAMRERRGQVVPAPATSWVRRIECDSRCERARESVGSAPNAFTFEHGKVFPSCSPGAVLEERSVPGRNCRCSMKSHI